VAEKVNALSRLPYIADSNVRLYVHSVGLSGSVERCLRLLAPLRMSLFHTPSSVHRSFTFACVIIAVFPVSVSHDVFSIQCHVCVA